MSECHSSNHPVSIVVVVVIINFLTLFTSLKLLHFYKTTDKKSFIWFGISPGDLFSSLFKNTNISTKIST